MKANPVIIGAVALVVLACFLALRPRRTPPEIADSAIVFNPPQANPEPLPYDFAFDHPAAKRAKQLFLALNVRSEDDYRSRTRRERYLLDVTGFEAMVTNGGITNYLYSGDGDHYGECLEALRDIGASSSYQCLSGACALFPNGTPSADTDLREQQLDELLKSVGDLDRRGEGGPEYELYELMLTYWDHHNNAEPNGADQPAPAPEPKAEGNEESKPKSEGRPK